MGERQFAVTMPARAPGRRAPGDGHSPALIRWLRRAILVAGFVVTLWGLGALSRQTAAVAADLPDVPIGQTLTTAAQQVTSPAVTEPIVSEPIASEPVQQTVSSVVAPVQPAVSAAVTPIAALPVAVPPVSVAPVVPVAVPPVSAAVRSVVAVAAAPAAEIAAALVPAETAVSKNVTATRTALSATTELAAPTTIDPVPASPNSAQPAPLATPIGTSLTETTPTETTPAVARFDGATRNAPLPSAAHGGRPSGRGPADQPSVNGHRSAFSRSAVSMSATSAALNARTAPTRDATLSRPRSVPAQTAGGLPWPLHAPGQPAAPTSTSPSTASSAGHASGVAGLIVSRTSQSPQRKSIVGAAPVSAPRDRAYAPLTSPD